MASNEVTIQVDQSDLNAAQNRLTIVSNQIIVLRRELADAKNIFGCCNSKIPLQRLVYVMCNIWVFLVFFGGSYGFAVKRNELIFVQLTAIMITWGHLCKVSLLYSIGIVFCMLDLLWNFAVFEMLIAMGYEMHTPHKSVTDKLAELSSGLYIFCKGIVLSDVYVESLVTYALKMIFIAVLLLVLIQLDRIMDLKRKLRAKKQELTEAWRMHRIYEFQEDDQPMEATLAASHPPTASSVSSSTYLVQTPYIGANYSDIGSTVSTMEEELLPLLE
uniref:Uncharacterized protein n=1 Tax=Ditylenchus dipsaci TaxID=166011 RepID=A0A915EMI1_9BILA